MNSLADSNTPDNTELTVEQPKRKRGRPPGSKDSTKIKLKPSVKDARKVYAKRYSELGLVAIYGVDKFTKELVYHMWNDPNQEFVVCDPIEQHVANLTRDIGSRPYSLHRYEAVHPVNFIESGLYPVVVVAAAYKEQVSKLPNPHNVEIICLEDL